MVDYLMIVDCVISTLVILNEGHIYALPSLKEGNVCACVRVFLNAINIEWIAFINVLHGCATYHWSTQRVGRPHRPQGRKRRHTCARGEAKHPQWALWGRWVGSAKRSEPVEEP